MVIVDYAYITFIGFDSLDLTHYVSCEMRKSSVEPTGVQRNFQRTFCISNMVA